MKVFCIEPVGKRGDMRPFDVAFASALARQHLDLTWVTNDETELALDGVNIWRPFRGIFDSGSAILRGARYFHALLRVFDRARRLRRHEPTLIHQQFTLVPEFDLVLAALAHSVGIPYILSPHDVIPYVSAGKGTLRLLYRHCNALIVHSSYARDQMLELLGTQTPSLHHLPLGNVNDYYSGDDVSTGGAREGLGIDLGARVILFAGQVKKEKGLEYLLQALPLVKAILPNVRLLIAGRPYHIDVRPYETLIDRLGVRDSVILRWGYILEHDLAVLHKAADVVALPYLRVYQSASCLTAYAFQRPVVAFNTGGLAEQVVNGRTGYVVPPRDVQALARALVEMLSDNARSQLMGRQGYQWIASTGDWDCIATATIQVYQSAVKALSGLAVNS